MYNIQAPMYWLIIILVCNNYNNKSGQTLTLIKLEIHFWKTRIADRVKGSRGRGQATIFIAFDNLSMKRNNNITD